MADARLARPWWRIGWQLRRRPAGGVYVIWSPLPLVREGRMVRVGQGAIRDRLAHHRGDENIAHHGTGSLLVTWAPCLPDARDGVVRFPASRYTPYEGGADARAEPVFVNLPIKVPR